MIDKRYEGMLLSKNDEDFDLAVQMLLDEGWSLENLILEIQSFYKAHGPYVGLISKQADYVITPNEDLTGIKRVSTMGLIDLWALRKKVDVPYIKLK